MRNLADSILTAVAWASVVFLAAAIALEVGII